MSINFNFFSLSVNCIKWSWFGCALLKVSLRSFFKHMESSVTIGRKELQNLLGFCSSRKAFKQGGFFIVPHLMCTKPCVLMFYSKDRPVKSPTNKGVSQQGTQWSKKLYIYHMASRVTYQNISPEVTRKPWRVISPDAMNRSNDASI